MPKRTDPGTLTEVKQAAVVDLGGKERAGGFGNKAGECRQGRRAACADGVIDEDGAARERKGRAFVDARRAVELQRAA